MNTLSYILLYGGFAVFIYFLHQADKDAKEWTKKYNEDKWGK